MLITVQQIAINVIDRGQGEPVLFLHGNPDSARVWDGVIDRMAPQFRCLAIDLPGFGDSGPGDGLAVSLEGLARFIDGVVTALELTPPIFLVVHDFGGPFGLAWTVRQPHKVKGLVIMNTVFSSDYRWHAMARLWRTPLLGELSLLLLNRSAFMAMLRRTNPRLSDGQMQQMYANFDPKMKRMILRLYRATDPEGFRGWEDDLQQALTHVPAWVLWGDRDPYIPAGFAESFGAGSVEHWPDVGHWPMLEQPERVGDRLMQLFR